MKKVFVFAALTLAVFSFSSCKKDYTCKCDQAISGTVVGTTSTIIKDSKSKAKTTCEDMSSSQTTGGVTQTVTCTIQ